MGGEVPTLKKCFKDEEDALRIFQNEIFLNLIELRKHGLFFTFTSDPFLPETIDLTIKAIDICIQNSIPVKVLTKRADFYEKFFKRLLSGSPIKETILYEQNKSYVAFGFSLTGHDELEPGASTNTERIKAMKILHEGGFKTFASIEPVIDFSISYEIMKETRGFCDLYKVGLESGKQYKRLDVKYFVKMLTENIEYPIYFKDSLLKQACISREELPANCVNRDYNLFEK